MKYLLWLLLCASAFGQCSSTAYGSFTCVQSCHGSGFTETTQTCVFGSNLTNPSTIYVVASGIGGAATAAFSGCGLTWNQPDSAVNGAGHATASNAGTGACTITYTSGITSSLQVEAVEITGSSGTVDGHSLTNAGFISPSGTSIPASAITTAVNGDLILDGTIDYGANSDTYTAAGGFTMLAQSTSFGIGIEAKVQAAAGAITPAMTSSSAGTFNVGALGLEASAVAPTNQAGIGGKSGIGGISGVGP